MAHTIDNVRNEDLQEVGIVQDNLLAAVNSNQDNIPSVDHYNNAAMTNNQGMLFVVKMIKSLQEEVQTLKSNGLGENKKKSGHTKHGGDGDDSSIFEPNPKWTHKHLNFYC